MKSFLLFFFAFVSTVTIVSAQPAVNASPTPTQRPRIVSSSAPKMSPTVRPTETPTPQTTPSATPQRVVVVNSVPPGVAPSPTPQASPVQPRSTVSPSTNPTPSPSVSPTSSPLVAAPNANKALISYGEFRTRLNEAKRFLQSRPMQTASIDDPTGFLSTSIVTLAAIDPKTQALHTITMPKESFLNVNFETYYTSSLGKLVRVRTIRANGVNTAVTVFDNAGQQFIPLVVQYPVERGGKFMETAYYTSAHPAILSPEVSKAGQLYLRTVF